MFRNPQERGSRRPAMRRNGVQGFSGFGGMVLNGDAASVPINRLRHGENIRFRGGNIRPRPGVVAMNAEPLHDANANVTSLVDFQVSPKKIYLSCDGCPGISTSIGASLNWYDSEQDSFAAGVYYTGATNNPAIGFFDGRVFVGLDNILKAFTLIEADYERSGISVSGFEQAEIIWDFANFVITALQEFDGQLFIFLDDGAGNGAVAVWNGVSIFATEDDPGFADTPMCATVWREYLVAGMKTGGIWFRSVGQAPDPSLWSKTAAAGKPARQILTYQDLIYWVGQDANLYKLSGPGGLAIAARTIVGAEMMSLEKEFGFLYYAYKTSGAPPPAKPMLGRFDPLFGGVFTDAHHDFSTDVATGFYPRTLRAYRGRLAVGLTTSPNSGSRILFSDGADTDLAYSVISPGSGDITQMLVA